MFNTVWEVMFRRRFWILPLICGLLLAGCAGGTKTEDKAVCENDRQEYGSESKSRIELVEEIMGASADGTRKIFSEMFNGEKEE